MMDALSLSVFPSAFALFPSPVLVARSCQPIFRFRQTITGDESGPRVAPVFPVPVARVFLEPA